MILLHTLYVCSMLLPTYIANSIIGCSLSSSSSRTSSYRVNLITNADNDEQIDVQDCNWSQCSKNATREHDFGNPQVVYLATQDVVQPQALK